MKCRALFFETPFKLYENGRQPLIPIDVECPTSLKDMEDCLDIIGNDIESKYLKYIKSAARASLIDSFSIIDTHDFFPDDQYGKPLWIIKSNLIDDPYMVIYLPGDLKLPQEAAQYFAEQWEKDPCYDLATIINDIPELEPYRDFFEEYQAQWEAEWEKQAAEKEQALIDDRHAWKYEFAGEGDSSLLMVDYFAANALPICIPKYSTPELAARAAYDIAEAMMRERSKRYSDWA